MICFCIPPPLILTDVIHIKHGQIKTLYQVLDTNCTDFGDFKQIQKRLEFSRKQQMLSKTDFLLFSMVS
jgi:hypothetical protein